MKTYDPRRPLCRTQEGRVSSEVVKVVEASWSEFWAAISSGFGRTFFEQLAPTRSVTLGWSSIALHWLSAQPGPLAGISPHLATPAEQNTWQATAAGDWVQFLSTRGGSGAERHTLTELLHGEAARGTVPAELVERLAIPVWSYRGTVAATVHPPSGRGPPCIWSTPRFCA